MHTYQRIPRLIDETISSKGGLSIIERGEADAAGDAFFETFDEWEEKLWLALAEVYHTTAIDGAEDRLSAQIAPVTSRAAALRHLDAKPATVTENRLLTKEGAIEKRHISKII